MAGDVDKIDELAAIQAIYCQPGETCVSYGSDSSKNMKLRITAGKDFGTLNAVELELSFFLPTSYPKHLPEISLRSDHLSKEEVAHLRRLMSETASQNIGKPMLLQIILLAKDELNKLVMQKSSARVLLNSSCNGTADAIRDSNVENNERLMLLHLDHMRAKTQYVKTIKKWVSELQLHGRLFFCQRLILILLQGKSSALKEYLIWHKTSNIDVDSKGHPCKERMLSVVCDLSATQEYQRIEDFVVIEENSAEDLLHVFVLLGLGKVFTDQVRTLKNYPGKC